jgi:hypothetical protein
LTEGVTLNSEDSLRFCALSMHEAGFIKSNPQRTDGSNLRFLDEQARAEDVSMRGLVLTLAV